MTFLHISLVFIIILTSACKNTNPINKNQSDEVQVPPVQRILTQIANIEQGDTLDSFLTQSNIQIDKDIKIIGGMRSLGEDGYVWQIGDTNHWIMCTTSILKSDEKDDTESKFENGQLVGIRVYYRDNISDEMDYDKMDRQFPYLEAYKLITKPAESNPIKMQNKSQ